MQIHTEESSPEKDSMMDSASQVASDISNAITAQKLEIDEKKRTVDMMKKAIVSVWCYFLLFCC